MKIFDHVGITVRDVERSLRFYREILGMSVRPMDGDALPRSEGGPGRFDSGVIAIRSESFDELTNSHGNEIKFVNLRSEDGAFTLQLIEYVEGGTGELELAHSRVGSVHLDVFVDDVQAIYDDLTARADVEITSPLVQIAPGIRAFYIADPDGIPIQFAEPM